MAPVESSAVLLHISCTHCIIMMVIFLTLAGYCPLEVCVIRVDWDNIYLRGKG